MDQANPKNQYKQDHHYIVGKQLKKSHFPCNISYQKIDCEIWEMVFSLEAKAVNHNDIAMVFEHAIYGLVLDEA